MQRTSFLTAVASGALFASVALGQATYNSNTGVALTGVVDDGLSTVTLGFPFTFPDGTVATDIDIDSNGRIFPTGADTSDFGESVGELLAETTALCFCWDDLSPQNGGGILFSTTATEAVITFPNCRSFGNVTEYSLQCQLFADGRFAFLYDGRLRTDEEPLIAVTEGGGATDPGSSDLSTLMTSAGVTTVYEDFLPTTVDLQDTSLEFISDGAGGWIILTGPANFPTPPINGVAAATAEPADSSLLFTPDGVGGFVVTRELGSWIDDTATGTDIGTGLGDDALTAALALGFSFDFPGGNTVTDIFVDNNGRILASDPTTGGDFNASVAELLGDPTSSEPAPASICAFWCDLSAQLGALRFATDNASQATITWENAPQFAESNTLSFQIVLSAPGSIQLNYRGVRGWRTGFGATSDDVLIGVSSGNSSGSAAVDPGASDFANSVLVSAGDPTVYEFWDASFDEQPDVQHNLVSLSTPALGGSLDIQVQGITSTTLSSTLFFGFSNPAVPLDVLGMSGGTLASSSEVSLPLTIAGDVANFSLALPNNPAFVGVLNIDLQTAQITAPAETGFLGVVLSNGLNISF